MISRCAICLVHFSSIALTHVVKALLLSHPHFLTRDTQVLASKHKVVNTRFPSLRILVEKELGVAIQDGEHSSVRSTPII